MEDLNHGCGDIDNVYEKSTVDKTTVAECSQNTEGENISEDLNAVGDEELIIINTDNKTISVETGKTSLELSGEDAVSTAVDAAPLNFSTLKSDKENFHQITNLPQSLIKSDESSEATADVIKSLIDNAIANEVAETKSSLEIRSSNGAIVDMVHKDKSDTVVADKNKQSQTALAKEKAPDLNQMSDKDDAKTEACNTDDKFADGDQKKKATLEKKTLVTDTIVNPLMLEEASFSPSSDGKSNSMHEKLSFSPSRYKMLDTETPCMLCNHIESNMDSKSHYDEYLCHLIVEHKLVIADVKLIADLQSYAVYWKKRFAEEALEIFCSKIKTNTGATDIGESEEYYLLCDALPEDKKIREQLQFDKLKKLLLRQEFERKDESFTRTCPFCSKLFQGNRLILFNHMTVDHNFNIGHPDNIVNVRELLDEIQSKLDKLQCLFCENVFRDRMTLREHMRKKGHRRLNPTNKEFDKYYMINYLELGKNWLVLQSESEKLEGSSDDWSGWFEEAQNAYCFFCKTSFDQAAKVYTHMKEVHEFDFLLMQQEMQLSFYQQIKLINYIRRRVHVGQQEGCADIIAKIKDDLQSNTKWNQPQYYFPTYEDDNILCQLEDKEGVFEPEDTFVIGEDGIDFRNIISSSVLTDLVVRGFFDS